MTELHLSHSNLTNYKLAVISPCNRYMRILLKTFEGYLLKPAIYSRPLVHRYNFAHLVHHDLLVVHARELHENQFEHCCSAFVSPGTFLLSVVMSDRKYIYLPNHDDCGESRALPKSEGWV